MRGSELAFRNRVVQYSLILNRSSGYSSLMNTCSSHQYSAAAISCSCLPPAPPPHASKVMAAAAVTVGDVRLTPQQLAGFDGSDPSKPLYIAVRGKIYDVSAGRSFYGPGAAVWGFCVWEAEVHGLKQSSEVKTQELKLS